MRNSIRGFYTGCIRSGNLGDDILFIIFLNFFAKIISNRYKIKCEVKQKDELSENTISLLNWIRSSKIGVIGGGSVIHPDEISYTTGLMQNESFIENKFILGSGISDSPKFRIPEENIKRLLTEETNNVDFPINSLMENNIKALVHCNLGGLRGPLDVEIAKSIDPGFNKGYIYDPGILLSHLTDLKKESDSNTIGINLANVTGDNRISDTGEDHSSYTKRISKVIYDFCIWALDNKYNLHLYSFGSGDSYLHNEIIEEIKKNKKLEIPFTLLDSNNVEEIAQLLCKFKFCISHRLHSNILVNSFGIPTICLGYNIKSLNYMKSIECQDLFIPTNSNLTISDLIRRVNLLENNIDPYIKKIKTHIQKSFKIYSSEFLKIVDSFNVNSVRSVEINYNIFNSLYGIYEINIEKYEKI